MQYHDMRALLAQLPADGRLTLHLAFRETYPSPWGAGTATPSWTVVVRDNARLPLPGTEIRYLYRLNDLDHFGRLNARDMTAGGLCILEARSDAACQLTWPEVLRLLDVAEGFPSWQVDAIVGTLEPEPRYGVTLRTEAGGARPLPSYAAFDRLCLEASPLGQRTPLTAIPAGGAGGPGRGTATAAYAGWPEPVRAWLFTPELQPRSYTVGGLAWLAPSGVCAWADLCAPDRDEALAVARQLGLPYRAVLAALSPVAEPWCRAYRDHVGVRVLLPRRDSQSAQMQADPLDLIVGPGVVVSIHASPLPALARVRQRVGRDLDGRVAGVPVLLEAIFTEVLSSEEALARWLARECHGGQGPGPADRGLATRTAGELQQMVERQHALLAEADRLSRQLHGRALVLWWGDLEARRIRLRAVLSRVEEPVDGTPRPPVSQAGSWRRPRRLVCAAVVLAGLIGLAAARDPHLSIVLVAAMGAFLIVVIVGAAVRVGR